MMKKTFLLLTLSAITALVICPVAGKASAKASSISAKKQIMAEKVTRYLKESESSALYDKLMDSYEETAAGELTCPDYYGGSYIDDDGGFVICIVATDVTQRRYAANSIRETIDSNDFKIRNVKYSYRELKEMMGFLNRYLGKTHDGITRNWTGHSLSNRKNAIIVQLSDVSDEQIALFKKEVTDSPMIQFVKSRGQLVDCANLNPGRGIRNPSRNIRGSMGYRAKSAGSIGFVTAGHVASTGDTIEGKSSVIGKVTISQNWGSVDAAFVKITSAHNPTNMLNGTNSTLSTAVRNPSEGQTVHMRGEVTGHSSGEIYETDAAVSIKPYNILFTNMTLVGMTSKSGDSGGIVYYNETKGSDTTRYTAGIIKGNDDYYTYYTKASLINSALNISRY